MQLFRNILFSEYSLLQTLVLLEVSRLSKAPFVISRNKSLLSDRFALGWWVSHPIYIYPQLILFYS